MTIESPEKNLNLNLSSNLKTATAHKTNKALYPLSLQELMPEGQWKDLLEKNFHAPYWKSLETKLQREWQQAHPIYPFKENIFAAFDKTPFDKVKVVLLGQDPYHGEGQAHGLCFSVKPGVSLPPSLVNIYTEMKRDLQITPPSHGHLSAWTEQGVFLLNSVLTVKAHQAASHQNMGWENFTDRVVEILNEKKEGLAFILWGSYAQKKGQNIDPVKHLVLKSSHPSPLSAHRGFFGSKPFSKVNCYLESQNQKPIQWKL